MIAAVGRRLDDENIVAYDTAIVSKLRKLTAQELAQLTDFGDVTQWHADRIAKEGSQE